MLASLGSSRLRAAVHMISIQTSFIFKLRLRFVSHITVQLSQLKSSY